LKRKTKKPKIYKIKNYGNREINKWLKDLAEKHNNEHYYLRYGRCIPAKCGGICCRMGVVKHIDKKNKDEIRFNKLMGHIILKKAKNSIYMNVPMACIELHGNKCNIQKTKPKCCNYFPCDPSQDYFKVIKDLCGYKFKRFKNEKYKRRKENPEERPPEN